MSDGTQDDIGCAEAARRLWAYVDGALDAPSADEIEAHLRRCARCNEVAALQTRFVETLGEAPASRASLAELEARVRARLAEERARGA